MSTLLIPCDPSTIFTVPATSSLALGVEVPIPIFPAGEASDPVSPTPNIALPILSWFDQLQAGRSVFDPIAILDDPVIILFPALYPTPTL